MEKLINNQTAQQFVKFAIVGVSSTAIDWSAFYVFNHFLGIYYLLSKVLSFILAVVNSYAWNSTWTFQSHNPKKAQEFIQFIVVSSIGLALDALIFYTAVNKIHLSYLPSLVIATGTVMIWNFTINKLWVFKKGNSV